MINYNGTIVASTNELVSNRAFLYGDAIFETVKVLQGKILFLEDHYFRLMASMRIIRMNIPMQFTMEYLEGQFLELARQNNCLESARVRMTVFRNDGGLYLPKDNNIAFIIQVLPLERKNYELPNTVYEVELFKDFYITKQLLSTIKSTNRLVNVVGSIFADENDFQNCLLLNDDKNVVEALNGNLFMLKDGQLITPPLSEGCINGIMRKQIISLAKQIDGIELIENPISPFDLQKADELFITNVISGIVPITQYRKKKYETGIAKQLIALLNNSLIA